MRPIRISRSEAGGLTFVWDDGKETAYTYQKLRDNCPCAVCNADRESDSPAPAETEGKYDLTGVKQVGSYAVQLIWKDGHDTGIYAFEYLRALNREDTRSDENKNPLR